MELYILEGITYNDTTRLFSFNSFKAQTNLTYYKHSVSSQSFLSHEYNRPK